MVAAIAKLNLTSPTVVDAALGRLGLWESSVDRPGRSITGQQLELPPSNLSTFTVRPDQPEQLLRFQGCRAERQFWLDVLPHVEPNGRRVTRFQQCGGYAWVAEDEETGELFLQTETCKLRICPVCRRRIQAKASARVLDFIEQRPGRKWQFHTFTLKHSKAPLPKQVDRLVKAFRNLRQRQLWKRHVETGYAVIEVQFHARGTYSPTGRIREYDEWHPHLHVVAQTEFIPWGPLRAAWHDITGDSDNIDCEPCESARHAATYVAKYIGKPPDFTLRGSPARAEEYYRSLQGRRLLIPFGDTSKHKAPPPPPPREFIRIARFADLLAAANRGSHPARHMLARVIVATVPRSALNLGPPKQTQLLLFDRAPP